MKATINIDHDVLDKMDITVDQFNQAISDALGQLTHPETGDSLYFNGVQLR